MNFRTYHELKRTGIAVAAASAYYVAIFFWGGSSNPASDAIRFLVTALVINGNLIYQTARLGALRLGALKRATPFRGRLDSATVCRAASSTVTYTDRSESDLVWNGVTMLLGAPVGAPLR